jgi:DNA-binding HxlR family transcriptional regulator
MNKQEIEILSWLKAGKLRREIISSIGGKQQSISEVAKITKISTNHVSRILKMFESKKIIRQTNPQKKIGKKYELTKLGFNLKKEIIR